MFIYSFVGIILFHVKCLTFFFLLEMVLFGVSTFFQDIPMITSLVFALMFCDDLEKWDRGRRGR